MAHILRGDAGRDGGFEVKSVKMIADLGESADRWYVTNGATAVGPVDLNLLARGIEAGRVPLESFVRHEAWKVWRPLAEIAEVTTAAPPPVMPAPPVSTDDITLPGRPVRPDEQTPADAVACAADLREAMLLLMTAAVQRVCADAAVVHRVDDGGAVAVCAHGPRMFQVLGERTRLLDPVVVAAAAGHVVVAEPAPGPAGDALLTRMACLGVGAEGAFMIPIRVRRGLVGLLEIGRRRRFRASEVADVEALVDALATKAETDGWG
jgi:hypothetical protein